MLAVVTYLHSSLLSGTSFSLPPDCHALPCGYCTEHSHISRFVHEARSNAIRHPRAAFIEIENRGLA